MANNLKLELHCHNIFSNHKNGSRRLPFDCGVRFEDQLYKAVEKHIDVVFVTNHNTLEGYRQMSEYKSNHTKFDSIRIYPAEEITLDNNSHLLAYGIHDKVRSGMTLQETLDEVRNQNAVSCAAHPFSVTNGMRENAAQCDIIESFNSNNVDRFSNIIAAKFAQENNIPTIAGSDSHVLTTIGRCINTLDSENNLDSILHKMRRGKIRVQTNGYASKEEIYEHAFYILSNSQKLLLDYAQQHYPHVFWAAKWALSSYTTNPKSRLWRSVSSFLLYLARRVSEKVNIEGHDPEVFVKRPWRTLISMGLSP